jgi:hypothetical protein
MNKTIMIPPGVLIAFAMIAAAAAATALFFLL